MYTSFGIFNAKALNRIHIHSQIHSLSSTIVMRD